MGSQQERQGCHPLQFIRRFLGAGGRQGAPHEEETTQTDEPSSREYYVRLEQAGAFVDDTIFNRQFFRTNQGEWFWLSGSGSPFDEDAMVPPGDLTDFLDSLVDDSADELPPLPPTSET